MKRNVIVSSCFMLPTRYDGKTKIEQPMIEILDYLKANGFNFIPVCPEQLGGLPTPRDPAEITNGKVISISGKDVTKQFELGATGVVTIAKQLSPIFAVLKEKSPSCGSTYIYNGTHSGQTVRGQGYATSALRLVGVPVFSENDLDKIKELIASLQDIN